MQRHASVLSLLAVLGACAYNPDVVSNDTGSDEATTAGETAPGPGTGVSATTSDTGDTVDTSGAGPTTDPTGADATGPSDSTGPGTDDSSGTAEEGSSGTPFVPCDGTCVSPATGEWTGPFRLETSDAEDSAPDCGDGWDLAQPEMFDGLVAPPAECGCSCGPAVGVTCTGSTRTARRFDPPFGVSCGLGLPDQTYALTPGQCVTVSPAETGSRWQNGGNNPQPQDGSCIASESSVVEDAAFTTRYTLCGEAESPEGECVDEGQCVTVADSPLCVMAEGDVECSPEGFSVKHVVYTGLTDTRDCSADCACSEPQGTCTAGGLQFRAGACGGGGVIGVMPVIHETLGTGSCALIDESVGSINYPPNAAPEPTASCVPTQPSPTGEASGVDMTTLCCNG